MICFDFFGALPKPLTKSRMEKLERVLSSALKEKKYRTVSVRFVSLSQIAALNRDYRKKIGPTDVLSFSRDTSFGVFDPADTSLGDIAICPTYAKKEAVRRSVPFEEECVRLLVHGVLHLKGFDHQTAADETRMFHLQEACVKHCITL